MREAYANQGEGVGTQGIPVDQISGHDQDHKAEEDLDTAHHNHPHGSVLDVLLRLVLPSDCWRSILLLWDGVVGHCRGIDRLPDRGMVVVKGVVWLVRPKRKREKGRGAPGLYSQASECTAQLAAWQAGNFNNQRSKRPPPPQQSRTPSAFPDENALGVDQGQGRIPSEEGLATPRRHGFCVSAVSRTLGATDTSTTTLHNSRDGGKPQADSVVILQ